jgi:hypothetical protein
MFSLLFYIVFFTFKIKKNIENRNFIIEKKKIEL